MKLKPLFLLLAASAMMLQAQETQNKDTSREKSSKVDPFRERTPAEKAAQAKNVPTNISISFETFSMPLQQAAQLQRENLADEEFYQRILADLTKDEVKQESLTIVRARSGETANADSIREYIYPTEYEEAEQPNTVGVSIAKKEKDKPDEIDQANLKALADSRPISEIKGLRTPATPTAFQTRNLGTSVEIQPTLGASGDIIDLRFKPESVLLAGKNEWGQEFSTTETPVFESQKTVTGATILPNRPYLLGTYNRPPNSTIDPDSANRVWFAFVTARIIAMKP
jgi:hypothetical protein